jgi:sugar lactone lactonase YvrE
MKLLRALQFSFALIFLVALAIFVRPFSLCAQTSLPSHPTAAGVLTLAPNQPPPERAYPSLHLPAGLDVTYLGMFSPDAVYRKVGSIETGEDIAPASHEPDSEVPPWMLLSQERTVDSAEPPARAQAVHRYPSAPALVRNHFLTYIYGHPSVVNGPQHVTTDSRQRLVVSDPGATAVHVLDPRGKTSFRVMTGKGRRIRVPGGVAVDSAGNIYVADPDRGMVAVLDGHGSFVRYIGSYHGEPQYARPTGIAIDRLRQRLFLVDTPRNMIFELTLDGKEIRKAGKGRDSTGTTEFDFPTDIAYSKDRVFVLDRWGSRVQVFDVNLNPVAKFDLKRAADPKQYRDNGLSVDQSGNVYVSSFGTSTVQVYSPDGKLRAVFGRSGAKTGEFSAPGGLWIDATDTLYVADAGNGRIQLFQIGKRK